MSNVKNTINCINKHQYKIKESKMTSKGRHIIKPKKLLTTSSDEKRKTKKRIIKGKCTDMCEELYDLQSSAAHPNILRDITFPNNMHKSKIKRVTSEISHDANHVLSRSISMDTSLSPNNHKQSVTHDSSHALSRNLTEDLNMSSNDHNLKLSVKYDKSHSLSRIFTGQDLSMSSNYENSKLLSKNNETVEPSGSINGLQKNIYHNNDGTRIKTLPTMLENPFVKSSNRTKSTNNISNIPEKENCQSISDSGVNDNGNTKNNKHNEYTSISFDVEQIPIVFHNDLQESGNIRVLFELQFLLKFSLDCSFNENFLTYK